MGSPFRKLSVRMLGSGFPSAGPLVPSIVGLLTVTIFLFLFLVFFSFKKCSHTANA